MPLQFNRAGHLSHTCKTFLIGVACVFAMPVPAAEPPAGPAPQALEFLRKVQSAARQLDYSGVYTYQQGNVMLSSRIVHIVDGTGERERIEMLDGAPREFIRHNDTTQCLIPEKKTIVMERRRGDRFPALILGDGNGIPDNYVIKVGGGLKRVAGRECSVTELLPRDQNRYGYLLCTDTKTHLLLKAQTVSPEHGLIDQMAFTSLQIGDAVVPAQLASSWDTKGWKVLETPMTPVDLAKSGWRIPFPAGFEAVKQVSRPMKKGKQVSQLVMSDGLAAISVFIEPYDASRDHTVTMGPISSGAMNVFRTRIGEHWLTSLGEVPADTLRDIAERTEFVPLAPK